MLSPFLLFLFPLIHAKQDCVPGDWSVWSNCDKSCGATGTHQRTRKILIMPTSDGRVCSDFQFKEVEGCNRICYNGGVLNTHECTCQRGWAGTCCEIDIDECANANGGCQQKCVNSEGNFKCECWEGFKIVVNIGGTWCEDINECSKENRAELSGCESLCMNFHGGYTCGCIPPKILEFNNKTCSDKNWCLEHKAAQGCKNGCVLLNNRYKCSCPTGYKLKDDGFTCEDIDECSNPNFCIGGTCQNFNYTATCHCGIGRGLDADGRKCIDVDECKAGMSQCSHTCVNKNAGHVCLCPAGYILGSDHKTCIDDNECLHDPSPCSHECTNLEGSFTCLCPEGYALQEDEVTCCELSKCKSFSKKQGAGSGGHGWIIGLSLLAVILVLGLIFMVWRQLKKTERSNEKVLRAIRTGDAPDVYYNRGADNIELETRGIGLTMGVAPTTGRGLADTQTTAPYQTFATHRSKFTVD